MKLHIRGFATAGIVTLLLMAVMCYLNYQEYHYTFVQEQRVNAVFDESEYELTRSLYEATKAHAQDRVNCTANELRNDLVKAYAGRWDQYRQDYDTPTEKSPLVQVTAKHLKGNYFRVKTDANDMFVASYAGILSDLSLDCAKAGAVRNWKAEISMHYNKVLAEQASEALVRQTPKDIVWRFRGLHPDSNKVDQMDVDKILHLPLDQLKDYEFLVPTYIDESKDLTGIADVSGRGERLLNRKLIVVQGFNLYEHIEAYHMEGYIRLNEERDKQLAIIAENRNGIAVKMTLSLATILISFFAISVLQNNYIRGLNCGKHSDHGGCC